MKNQVYNKYQTKVFNRRTLKELYTLPGESVLTEKEAIEMQISLSTAEKVFILEIVK